MPYAGMKGDLFKGILYVRLAHNGARSQGLEDGDSVVYSHIGKRIFGLVNQGVETGSVRVMG
jgi:phage gp45-like